MSKTFKFLGRSRDTQRFDNPLIGSGLGMGRRNQFQTSKEKQERQRRMERRNKLRRTEAWDF